MGQTFAIGGVDYALPTDDSLKATSTKTHNIGGVEYALPDEVSAPVVHDVGGVEYQLPTDNLVEANKINERGFGQRFADSLTDSLNYGFVGNTSRWINDYLDTGKDQLKKQFPGHDDAWYEETHDKSISELQRHLREEAQNRQNADPN